MINKKSVNRNNQSGTIYIFSIKTEENLYKLGATIRDIDKRKNEYSGKIAENICLTYPTKNCFEHESNLKVIFNEKFIQRTDYGIEYFEGELHNMFITIGNYFENKNNFNDDDEEEYIETKETFKKLDEIHHEHKCDNCFKIFRHYSDLVKHQFSIIQCKKVYKDKN